MTHMFDPLKAMIDSDTFVIDFPKECTVDDKALLFGSTLLLDNRHYERDRKRKENRENATAFLTGGGAPRAPSGPSVPSASFGFSS